MYLISEVNVSKLERAEENGGPVLVSECFKKMDDVTGATSGVDSKKVCICKEDKRLLGTRCIEGHQRVSWSCMCSVVLGLMLNGGGAVLVLILPSFILFCCLILLPVWGFGAELLLIIKKMTPSEHKLYSGPITSKFD